MMTDRMAHIHAFTHSCINTHFTFLQLQGFSSDPGIGELRRVLDENRSRGWAPPDWLYMKAFCALQIVANPIRYSIICPNVQNFRLTRGIHINLVGRGLVNAMLTITASF